jgi:hypothetical protein
MNDTLIQFIIAIIVGLGGYIIAYIKEHFQLKKQHQREKVTNMIENRLQSFLWPLYFLLKELRDVGKQFKEKELINCNKSIINILHRRIYLTGEQEMVDQALKYISAFNSWRISSKSYQQFPFEEANEFLAYIRNKTSKEQATYNGLIGLTERHAIQDTRPWWSRERSPQTNVTIQGWPVGPMLTLTRSDSKAAVQEGGRHIECIGAGIAEEKEDEKEEV